MMISTMPLAYTKRPFVGAGLRREGGNGWRLIWSVLGGTQRISTTTALSAHTEDTLQVHHDLATNEMVYRIYKPSPSTVEGK